MTERPAGRVIRAGLPTATPATRGTLDRLRRELVVGGDRAAAGVGPTHVIDGPGGLMYVVDTTGDGLLVFETRPHLHLTRRLPLLGKPYGIARDPVNGRLYVAMTATNELVQLADGARPHRLRAFPTVHQPEAVGVDPRTGRVYVSGRDGDLQIVDGRDTAVPTRRTARR